MSPKRGNPSGGEQIDRTVADSVRLAHRALERFPDLVRRHKFIAGGAAISSSLIVLAGVAIARRMLAGQSPEEALASVTEAEVEGLHVVEADGEGAAGAAAAEAASPAEATPAAGADGSDGTGPQPAAAPATVANGQRTGTPVSPAARAASNGSLRPHASP